MAFEFRTLEQKLSASNTPKKILSLDGGGVRGILTLGMLKKIETLIRAKYNNPSLVLSDYYDLIGGTSTGAIIASGLALGWEVDKLIELYSNLGKEIFGKGKRKIGLGSKRIRAILDESYSSEDFESFLKNVFGEITIGDKALQCGLAINCKRADTYSLWTMTNSRDGIYSKANSHLKLWELCRASSAAIYYFKAKQLNLKKQNGEPFEAVFIDGGISTANNPLWQLFLTATYSTFGFNWNAGKDNIMITGLGTGIKVNKEKGAELLNKPSITWFEKMADLFMVDSYELNRINMEILGCNIGPKEYIDSQFREFSDNNYLTESQKLFTFARFNLLLHQENLNKILPSEVKLTKNQSKTIDKMDHFENMDLLLQIGTNFAEKEINESILW